MHPVKISHCFRPMLLRRHPATGVARLSQRLAFPQLIRLARPPAMLGGAAPRLASATGPHFFARRLRRNAGTSMPLLGGARAGDLPTGIDLPGVSYRSRHPGLLLGTCL